MKIIIVGKGRVGGSLGRRLESVGKPVYYCDYYKELFERPPGESDIIFLTMPPKVVMEAVPKLITLPGYFIETSSVKGALVNIKTDNLLLAHPLAGTIVAETKWLLGMMPPLGIETLLKSIGQQYEIIDMEEHDKDLALGSHALYLLSNIVAEAPGRGGVMKEKMGEWKGKQKDLWREIIHLNKEEVADALRYYQGEISEIIEYLEELGD